MDGLGFGWLEIAPLAITAVIVFRHFRDARRATPVAEEGSRAPHV